MSEQKYFRRKKTIESADNGTSLISSEEKKADIENKESEKSEKGEQISDVSEESVTAEEQKENLPAEVESRPLTLSASKEEILKRVSETDSIDELKELANLFGISLTKKEIARASKESDLLDTLLARAEERIRDKGDYLSNDEILEFMKAFQGNINNSKKSLTNEIDTASVSITKNEINVNVNTDTTLSRESRDKVLEVVNMLLKGSQTENVQIDEPIVLENEDDEE